jgi:serine/threonine protein kinase
MPSFPCPRCGQPLADQQAHCPFCAPDALGCGFGSPTTIAPDDPHATLAPIPGEDRRDRRAPPGYQILAEVGRGGMGVVYRARQASLDRVVALKMILSGPHSTSEERLRFQREAESIARLRHRGIVTIHEIGEHDEHPFIALEFCEGGSLEERLRGTPLPPREAAALVRQLAEATQAA